MAGFCNDDGDPSSAMMENFLDQLSNYLLQACSMTLQLGPL